MLQTNHADPIVRNSSRQLRDLSPSEIDDVVGATHYHVYSHTGEYHVNFGFVCAVYGARYTSTQICEYITGEDPWGNPYTMCSAQGVVNKTRLLGFKRFHEWAGST
jgi:hypothetical protein